jgi:hypothetical protein
MAAEIIRASMAPKKRAKRAAPIMGIRLVFMVSFIWILFFTSLGNDI